MKRLILNLLSSLLLALTACAQSADDLNEGTQLIPLGDNLYEFRWWAREGVHYLVDVSEDLTTWTYLNDVFVGSGDVSSVVFYITADHLFARLNKDPFNTDKDGDGIPDGWEVLHGLNPRDPNDALAMAPGGVTYLQKYVLGLDPEVADTDGDGVDDGTEIANNTDPKSDQSNSPVWRTEWREIGYSFIEYVGDPESSIGGLQFFAPNYYFNSSDLTSRTPFTSLAGSLAADYQFADTPDESGRFDVAPVYDWTGLFAGANAHVATEVHHWSPDVTENTDWAYQEHRRVFLEIHPAPTVPITRTMLKVTERVIDAGASVYQVEPVTFTLPAGVTKSAPVDLIPSFSTSPPSGNHSEYVGVSLLPAEITISEKVYLSEDQFILSSNVVVAKGSILRLELAGVPSDVALPSGQPVWKSRQLKPDGTYTNWDAMGANATGKRFDFVTSTSGVFQLEAVFNGDDAHAVKYVRTRDEKKSSDGLIIGPGKNGDPDSFGVCTTEYQVAICKKAETWLGSADYSRERGVPAKYNFSAIPRESDTCNIFVAHVACSATAFVPAINGIRHSYPPVANQWAGTLTTAIIPGMPFSTAIQNWELLSAAFYPEPGFIIAHPSTTPTGEGHCAIIDYDGGGIGAGTSGTVNKRYPYFFDGTSRYRTYVEGLSLP